MRTLTLTAEETKKIGRDIGKILLPGDVVLLEGDLSAGKTTFAQGIGEGLGVTKIVNSPTFTIVKTYQGIYPFHHLDLYRLDGLNEDFDLEEYLNPSAVCVIEWPYRVNELIPSEYILVKIKAITDCLREIMITGKGNRYRQIEGEINELLGY